jgi:mannose-6-phosphate isomerase-like protein (cupin superfamily)
MRPQIFSTLESSEFYTQERCHIIEIMNKPGIDFSIARARIEPGIATALHAVKATIEAYYILQGNAIVEGDGLQRHVGPGDVVLFAPDAPQTIKNVGEFDLIFLCVCLPRFQNSSYINLE